MATWLRQSTSVDVPVGPFLDENDGKTAETTLTITQPDVRLKKNAGAWAQKAAAQTLSHEEAGWYEVTLDATDTNTLGVLLLAIHESGALPVWREFLVVTANVWDSYLAADLLQIDVTQLLNTAWLAPGVAGTPDVNVKLLGGGAQSVTDLKDFADDGYDPSTNKVQGVVLTDTVTTYTGNTPQTGDVFPLASTEIADIKAKTDLIPSDPADASDIATRFTTLDTAVADLPTNAELATALATADDAVLTAVADLPTNAELATALGTADDAVLSAIAAVASTLTTISGLVDDLESRLTAARAGYLDILNTKPFIETSVSDLTPAVGDFTAAAGLSAVDDFYNGSRILFTSGALKGVERSVSDYTGATRTFAFTGVTGQNDAPWPSAPADGDTFIIAGRSE